MSYFNRHGDAIEYPEWKYLRSQEDYCKIQLDVIGQITIKTEWIGNAELYGPSGPIIFKTLVINEEDTSVETYTFSSKHIALGFHHQVVRDLEMIEDNIKANRWYQIAGELE